MRPETCFRSFLRMMETSLYLHTSFPFDYEVQSSYMLELSVSDGMNSAYSNCSIYVEDVNEAPCFQCHTLIATFLMLHPKVS